MDPWSCSARAPRGIGFDRGRRDDHPFTDYTSDYRILPSDKRHEIIMGATSARAVESEARRLAEILKSDEVDTVLLCPV